MIKRRALLGALPLLAAPAIVRPGLLMRLSTLLWRPEQPPLVFAFERFEAGFEDWRGAYGTLNNQWQDMRRGVNDVQIIADEAIERHELIVRMREMEMRLAASFRRA